MKSFNTQYKDLDSLKKFLSSNLISDSSRVLIQIFSGVINEKLVLKVSAELKKILPSSSIIGTTTSGEILNGRICKETITISFSIFEKTIVKSNLYLLNDEFDVKNIADELILDNTKALIVFSDGLKSNAEKLLKDIYSINPEIVIAGGRAGDNAYFERTFVLMKKSPVKRAVL